MASLFLCGDVMTGRGIDQVLPHPSKPRLFEGYVTSATDYVALAERAHGTIGRRKDFAYVWGDALAEMDRRGPDARIANLETAVTTADEPWPGKGIHYRMHPANVPCLAAARLDCCVLANNHAMDWGRAGLAETLAALRGAGIRTAGAGLGAEEAAAPAALALPGAGRVLVYGFACESSGVPADWAAREGLHGVNLLPDLSTRTVDAIARRVGRDRGPGDVVVASIHWGSNWGYGIAPREREFAHALVAAGVDVVHGHSSHHPQGVEVHRGRLVLHGCGDLVNDYEGISGWTQYRPELSLLYFPTLDARGALSGLEMVAMRMHRFRLERASQDDCEWLAATLGRESARLGTALELRADGSIAAGAG